MTEAVLGIPPETFVGTDAAALIHPDDQPTVVQTAEEMGANPGLEVTRSYRMRHPLIDDTWWRLRVTSAWLPDDPVIGGVANAASYVTGAVSPGENIVIFGSGIGPATLTFGTVVNNAFTTVVANTRVLFDNIAAPVYYASNGQTSVWVPYGLSGRTSTNIVVEYFGVQSAAVSQSVALAVPGIYTQNAQGTGPGSILNQDGVTLNTPATPEKRGNVISIYMTGEGQTNPGGVDGAIIPPVASALKTPIQTVTVTIGGVDATVAYAGSAAGLVSGLMQVNAFIPLTAPTGTQPVVVTVGGMKSQSGAGAATVVVSQ